MAARATSGTREWSPRRLTHIRRGRDEALLDAAIAGNRGQYTTGPRLARVDDHLAVGCDAGALVAGSRGEDLCLARRVIHVRELEAIAFAPHVDESAAVRYGARRDVVAALEREA